MEDTEEETGREGEWREERSIVGGYDGGHRGGDREAVEGGSGNGERREAL